MPSLWHRCLKQHNRQRKELALVQALINWSYFTVVWLFFMPLEDSICNLLLRFHRRCLQQLHPVLWRVVPAVHHEGQWESGCIDPRFIDLGTSWRWVVRFTHRPLYPPGTHWIGGWVNLRTDLDDMNKEKVLDPNGTWTPTPRSSGP
jgi:hypothetical protein